MADFDADPAVRVMVLTGAGGKAFASGADISRFKDERQQADAVAHYQETTQKSYEALMNMRVPTIAMIRGYCIGGGTAVAVCCDLRICTENAKGLLRQHRLQGRAGGFHGKAQAALHRRLSFFRPRTERRLDSFCWYL
jgi:enoyl-CoA hydratase/carnithine racemase